MLFRNSQYIKIIKDEMYFCIPNLILTQVVPHLILTRNRIPIANDWVVRQNSTTALLSNGCRCQARTVLLLSEDPKLFWPCYPHLCFSSPITALLSALHPAGCVVPQYYPAFLPLCTLLPQLIFAVFFLLLLKRSGPGPFEG